MEVIIKAIISHAEQPGNKKLFYRAIEWHK